MFFFYLRPPQKKKNKKKKDKAKARVSWAMDYFSIDGCLKNKPRLSWAMDFWFCYNFGIDDHLWD